MGGCRARELIRTETTEEKRNDKIRMRGQGLNSRVNITGWVYRPETDQNSPHATSGTILEFLS
jgi:hypothetical protein